MKIIKNLIQLNLIIFILFSVFTNSIGAIEVTTISIDINQEVTKNVDKDVTYNYIVKALDGSPLPNNESEYSFSITNTSSKTIDFTFTEAGYYHYQVYQVTGSDNDNTYDEKVYEVRIYLRESGLQTIILMDYESDSKVDEILFHNTYNNSDNSNNKPNPGDNSNNGTNTPGNNTGHSSNPSIAPDNNGVDTSDSTSMFSLLLLCLASGLVIIRYKKEVAYEKN
ncbi:Spy0128 family protein [Breznakia pachnodae]|uniref:Pilin isopeptide linkage protein n=1 Tax=Breznakia pachnodae TaxID=265178 RepID=A0ABU0E1G6_9FIRM|nr:FctA domain-containing protein [Breznakia pachnodae]MDQ0360714.1 pilin isopeptide linkage protein [Breznakia pachnodae]